MNPIPGWQQRVIEEKSELDEKIEKLDAYLKALEGREMKDAQSDHRRLLVIQCDQMRAYSKTLSERIEMFPQLS
jgi:hypothetical protein